jgi:hypothetical protein
VGWSNKKVTLVIAFDIAQFFPSLNHDILLSIFDHFGFDDCVVNFFSDYLVNRKTQYVVNGEKLKLYDCTVGVGQSSALSPIALYITSIFHMMDVWNNPLDGIPPSISSFLSFVDDGLLIATDSSYERTHDSL